MMASSSALGFNVFPREDSSMPIDCTTEISGDYYGFGVRLGVYFAWLGSYFANTLLPGEISGSLDTNTIFLLALLISLFNGTHKHSLYQIDGLVVLHLSSGFLFSCLSVWGYRTMHYQKEGVDGIAYYGGVGTHCRLMLVTAISMYGAWFWWEGVDDGLRIATDPQCSPLYTWFLGKWPISGGIHIFYIIVTIGCSIYYGTMCLVAMVTIVYKLFASGHEDWKKKFKFETGLNNKELKFMYNVQRIFNLVWIIFCANIVEMTLNYNHMLGTLAQNSRITTPAQLLPFLVGTLSFVRTLWLIFKEHGKTVANILRADAEMAENEAPKFLHIVYLAFDVTIRRIISPLSVSSDATSTARRERSPPDTPHRYHPWHRRYLVAWLPWLSVFKFWKHYCPVEERLPTTHADSPHGEDIKLNTSVHEYSSSF